MNYIGNIPAGVLGGMSNGDKQRPIFGDKHMLLPHTLPLANDAKLLCDGLVVLRSESDAGDEHRASRLTARSGLGERGHCKPECSLGIVVRPSGP